jgi:hypothetical protein
MTNHDHEALRRLARAIVVAAINDRRKAISRKQDDLRREYERFLSSHSVWHDLLGIDPDRARLR